MNIEITQSSIDHFKKRLAKTMPIVKHSHRLEAFARGCGFNTFAAMKNSADTKNERAEFNCIKFENYLSSKGFHPNEYQQFTDLLNKMENDNGN